MSKDMLFALGGGGLSAAAAMAFLAGSPGALVFLYLAPLPLFLVGLGLGAKAGTIAGLTGFMVAGLAGGGVTAALYGLLNALPAGLVVRQALLQRPSGPGGTVQWYPVGSILCWLTALGAALFLAAVLASHAAGTGGIMATVVTYLSRVFEIMAPGLGNADRARLVATLAPLFPGFAVISWVLMTVINGALAEAVLVRLGRNLRPPPPLSALALPQWISLLLVAAAAVALLGSLLGPGEVQYIGRNLVVMMAVPFFFIGLAVVHALARRLASPVVPLAAFYVIIVLFSITAVAVAAIGLVEQWGGGLRRRFAGPGNDRESA